MRKVVRSVVLTALALAATGTLSIIITVLLFPFWTWVESSFGIESIGHSGPAGWCYLFVFTVLIAAMAAKLVLRIRSGRRYPSI